MQQLSFVLFQLDEARRYLLDGRAEHLRLALLLLDNAVEIELYRHAMHELMVEGAREPFRTNLLKDQALGRPLTPELQQIVDWEPLSKKAKRNIDRFFDAKVDFLTKRHTAIDERLAAPLKYLHQYRNEAHHRAIIRPETLQTAGALLFEICCEVLLQIGMNMRGHWSPHDYSWLEKRFGVRAGHFCGSEESLKTAVDELRKDISPDLPAVIRTLSAHLRSRIEDSTGMLDFIVESHALINDRETALTDAQFHTAMQDVEFESVNQVETAHQEFVPDNRVADLSALERGISTIARAADRLEAFDLFSAIERDLERIEHPIHEFAHHTDAAIQHQVDILRGK